MPHSKQINAKKDRIDRTLKKRLKNLQKLKPRHFEDQEIITLDSVSLGDLRQRYKPRHFPLHPAVLRSVPKFIRLPSGPRPVLIYGSDGGLLACRAPLNRPDLIQRLSDTIDHLDQYPPKNYKHKGIQRSEYKTRHLGVWAAYMKQPKYTKEHRDHSVVHDQFLQDNSELFREMSAVLGQMAPGIFKEFQRYPLAKGQSLDCGAWAACVINNGGNNPNQTEIHRDVKESQYGYSCIVSCGDYTGGDLILYDLGYILQISPGDILLFPDSLIHHSNEPAQGVRKSVVTFTQENVYDYWHRQYHIPLRRKLAAEKRKEKAKDLKRKLREAKNLELKAKRMLKGA